MCVGRAWQHSRGCLCYIAGPDILRLHTDLRLSTWHHSTNGTNKSIRLANSPNGGKPHQEPEPNNHRQTRTEATVPALSGPPSRTQSCAQPQIHPLPHVAACVPVYTLCTILHKGQLALGRCFLLSAMHSQMQSSMPQKTRANGDVCTANQWSCICQRPPQTLRITGGEIIHTECLMNSLGLGAPEVS